MIFDLILEDKNMAYLAMERHCGPAFTGAG
jgi:hypothetical protein